MTGQAKVLPEVQEPHERIRQKLDRHHGAQLAEIMDEDDRRNGIVPSQVDKKAPEYAMVN